MGVVGHAFFSSRQQRAEIRELPADAQNASSLSREKIVVLSGLID